MDAHTDNIYSIFRDKLLLLGEHIHGNLSRAPSYAVDRHMGAPLHSYTGKVVC